MGNKIYTNHTLEEYNKKYANKNLKKVNKVDADKDPKLLSGHSWWLIKDTYYEIPNNKGFKAWWTGLGKTGQIVACCIAGAAVVTAVVVPTVIAVTSNKTGDRTIDITGGSLKDSKPKQVGETLEFDLTCSNDKNEITEISKVTVGNIELSAEDYTFDKTNHKLIIKKSGLDKGGANANITIVVVEKEKGPVTPVYVTKVTISAPKETIKVGETLQFNASIEPEEADKDVKWSLAFPQTNESIATIDENGLLTAHDEGVVHVSAYSTHTKDGSKVTSDIVSIEINDGLIHVESVSVKPTTTIIEGKTETLSATVLPENASDKSVKWSSSDPEVATVDENTGLVTAVKPGSVDITVTTNDGGLTSICKVTVDEVIYKIDWCSKTFDLLGDRKPKTLYKFATDAYKIEFANEDTVGINLVGETSDDKIYATYTKSGESNAEDKYVLKIWSPKKIGFNDNDLHSESGVIESVAMFYNCSKVNSIDLDNVDISQMTGIQYLFAGCKSLEEIKNIDCLNTSNIESMDNVFAGTSSLKTIDVSSFNTSSCYLMISMFANTSATQIKGLNNFDTSKVETFACMFEGCDKFITLDLSAFNTNNLKNTRYMFKDCTSLETIYVNENADFTKAHGYYSDDDMFENCKALKGGAGSTVESIQKLDSINYLNAAYARIDKGNTIDTAGYFTSKEATLEKLSFINPTSEEPYTCEVKAASDSITNEIVIPSEVDGSMCGGIAGTKYKVTKIANNGFNSIKGITSLITPSTLTSIGENAFSFCTSLSSVTLNENIVEINKASFKNIKIKNINIPDSVKLIGEQAFHGIKIENVYISKDSKLNEIARGAFAMSHLTSFYIPKEVSVLGGSCISTTDQIIMKLLVIDSPTIAGEDNPGGLFERGGWEKDGDRIVKVPLGTVVGSELTNHYTKETPEGNYDVYSVIGY